VSSEEVEVFGFGENSIDKVLTGSADHASRFCGGQVATTMVACARLGLRASYAGAVGDDEDGRFVRETMASNGVIDAGIFTRPAATRSAVILVDAASGERQVRAIRSPELNLPPDTIDATIFGTARIVHVDDTDIHASLSIAELARQAERLVTTDIDRGSEAARGLLALATHPILSEGALEMLTGETDPEAGLRALRRDHRGPIVVTLGPRGSMALEGDTITHVPAPEVHAVDTTGAGDVFRAGYIYGLLMRGRTMAEMLRFANAAAALSTTMRGAINGAPTLNRVESLLSK
jgi:sulfofructose kinase